jgi:hypothetical protein
MFSFAGDTVLDPFAGTGTTAVAAISAAATVSASRLSQNITRWQNRMAEATLLRVFRAVFEGKQYKHCDSSLGDLVASYLYEDLVALNKSALEQLRGRIIYLLICHLPFSSDSR